MGLWIKCPGCQEQNPLSASVCAQCGRSLINLPSTQRVYVIETGAAAARPSPAPTSVQSAPPAPAPPAAPAKPEKKPKGRKKKK